MGGSPAAFVLADEIPHNPHTPATSAHPTVSALSDESPAPAVFVSPNSTEISRLGVDTAFGQTTTSTSVHQAPVNHRRRRRALSPDPDTNENRSSQAVQGYHSSQEGPSRPLRKRRRVAGKTMRLNNENPQSSRLGPKSSPSQKSMLANGSSHSQPTTNGSVSGYHANGEQNGESTNYIRTYFGHDREEVTRILIQGLHDLGYNGAAVALSRESGFDLESPFVAAFRNAVLQGEWTEAEELLFGSLLCQNGEGDNTANGNNTPSLGGGLLLAEGADRTGMLFSMRQQKFLELLEKRDRGSALMVLRQELTPLDQDSGKIPALSSLIMCQSEDDLRQRAEWDGAAGRSRLKLLSDLSHSISPSVMIPEHRLAILLQQVKQNQISNCLYHNTAMSPSLYSDHSCDRSQFPLRTVLELNQHSDEVWYLEFSHDGSRLATASADNTVIIYDTSSFKIVHTLADHLDKVAYVSWSPDDSKLITCSFDSKARVWDTMSGNCVIVIDQHAYTVTTAAWAPDGQSFVTGSHDSELPLCLWDLNGNRLYMWAGSPRITDCSISPDGQKLVAMSPRPENKLCVYNFVTREEIYSLSLKVHMSCVNISQDSGSMLVNMANNEIHLMDIKTTETIRRFLGQKQGEFVIRSNFGGGGENFVISGSEDSRIHIWHKENGTLVESLDGHSKGCVNAVAWNPKNPGMFASAGDDNKVRIWSKASSLGGRNRDSVNGFGR
ncbi:MAG: hypothetical protein M1812_001439 [Candelaria pacifica]|nr:MAG: hypothetical protein M1812_001439 [Candelaria pacifica]